MNKLFFTGNLGKDPDMRYIPSGTAVCTLSVASNRKYRNSADEIVEEVTWYRVDVWGKQAEACHQYLNKGRQVLVEGRLKPDEYGNPRVWTTEEGEARASYEVTADRVEFLGGREE